jgi:outer membrane PBP1 activator LpoA protein
MNPISNRTAPRLCALALLLLAGCGTPATRPMPGPSAPPGLEQAERAEKEGAFVRAAREYERLARDSASPQREHLQLKRIEALVKAGQVREARAALDALGPVSPEPGPQAYRLLLEAQIAAADGEPARALELLAEAERVRHLDPALQAEIQRARAQAELALERPFEAVASLIRRERFLARRDEIADNQQQLWQILEAQGRPLLQRAFLAGRDAVLAGWLDLALQAMDHGANPARLAAAIENWRKAYPGHPATELFLNTLASPASGPRLSGRIERIALLLPLSSEHAQAAQAVHDGFLAMQKNTPAARRPRVQLYDIGRDPLLAPSHYSRAVADGAQFVVGPLGLEAVEQVARKAGLEVPTLLLSHTAQDLGGHSRYVFQFGLPPEQEAAQAAERAYLDGHRRAALLVPASPWGQRMENAFVAAWERLGGLVVARQAYTPDQPEYATPVRHLLNIHLSEIRKEALEARLRAKLKYEPRPREDIDFVFLATDARHARLIKPQINYHRAARVPVYTTSHVFSGRSDPVADADLDGIRFPDMPWILIGEGRIEELRASLANGRTYARGPLDRLYALGLDAYALIPQLARLAADPGTRYPGVTSSLGLGGDGRVQRQLLWARFRKGAPQLIDSLPPGKGQFEPDDGPEDILLPEPRT